MNKISTQNKQIFLFFIFLYLSLVIGFFLNEDAAGGAKYDFSIHEIVLAAFKENFHNTFFYYTEFNNDHSPFYLLFLYFIDIPFNNTTILRFLYLHICLLVPLTESIIV